MKSISAKLQDDLLQLYDETPDWVDEVEEPQDLKDFIEERYLILEAMIGAYEDTSIVVRERGRQ